MTLCCCRRIQQLLGPTIAEHRLLFEMHPAHAHVNLAIPDQVTNGLGMRYCACMNQTALNFLSGLLHMDPQKRLDAQACLRHSYLRSLALSDAETKAMLTNV
jgi:hypothetical protein